MAGWRWLLLIEGVVAVAFGFRLSLILPDWPHDSRVLSSEQRLLAHVCILRGRYRFSEPEELKMTPVQALATVRKDGRTYFFLVM